MFSKDQVSRFRILESNRSSSIHPQLELLCRSNPEEKSGIDVDPVLRQEDLLILSNGIIRLREKL